MAAFPWSSVSGLGAISPAQFQALSRDERAVAWDTKMTEKEREAVRLEQYYRGVARLAAKGGAAESGGGGSDVAQTVRSMLESAPSAARADTFVAPPVAASVTPSEDLGTGTKVVLGVVTVLAVLGVGVWLGRR